MYELDGIDTCIFDAFLTFVYTYEVKLCPEIAFGLMKLSTVYEMDQLRRLCTEYVLKTLTQCNIWTYFCHSVDVFQDEYLRAKCLDFISNSDGGIFHREDFLRVSRGALKLLLEMESIRVTESELLEVIIKWIDFHGGRGDRRTFLGDLWYLIRFPAMSSSEFGCVVEQYLGLLSDEEVHQVRLAISGAPSNSPFSKHPRMRLPRILSSGGITLKIIFQFSKVFGSEEHCQNLRMALKIRGKEETLICGIGILVEHGFDQAISGEISIQINTESGWKDDSFPAIEGGHQMAHGRKHKLLFLIFQEFKMIPEQWYRINLTTKCDKVVKVEGEFHETANLGENQVKFIHNDKHSSIPLVIFK